jgi:hypothetical protein
MSMALLNTVALPNVLLAHGKNHVAVYQNGVVSTYAKDEANNTLTLQPTTYALADVLALKMSNDGTVIAAQTVDKTYRLTGGVQTPIDIVGAFDVASNGTIVIVSVTAQQISVVQTLTRNFSVAVTANDKIAIGSSTFIVYNKSRYLSGSFIGSTVAQNVFAYSAAFVIAATGDKFAFFFENGSVQYNGLTRTGMPKLYYHRNVGNFIVANDGAFDWAYQRLYPQSNPDKLRANVMEIPASEDMTPYVWSQFSFQNNQAIEDVTEAAVLLTNATVSSNKLVNTSATGYPLDRATPVYFSASEDFSIEGWLNMSAIPDAAALLSMYAPSGSTNFAFFVGAQIGNVLVIVNADGSNSSTGRINVSAAGLTLNNDHHIAVCRVSGVLKIYLNGAQIYSAANNTATFKSTEFLNIRNGAIGRRWGMRICRGKSAYTDAFEPLATLPALTPQYYEPAVRDDIVFQAAFRNNSLLNEMDFVGGRQIVMAGPTSVANGRLQTTAATTSRFSAPCKYFGAGDFTIELLFRLPAYPGTAENCVLGQYIDPGNPNSWLLWYSSGGGMIIYTASQASGGTALQSLSLGSNLVPLNRDVHLVVEKVNNVLNAYMDGVLVGTQAHTFPLMDNTDTVPMRNNWNYTASTNPLSIKWIRIAKRAMYNGVIKPLAAPPKVKAIPTSLIKEGVVAKGITATGGSASAGSWRMPFNAYLTMPNAPELCPGSKDFVCEVDFSVQTATTVSGSAITPMVYWGTWAAPGKLVNYEIQYSHTAQQFVISASHDGTAGTFVVFPFALAFNTQYLVKFIRTAGVLACFVNGTKIGESPYTENLLNDVSSPFYIGRRIGGSTGNVFWYGDWTVKNFSIGVIDQTP